MYCGEGPIPTLSVLARTWLDVHEKTVSQEHLRNVEEFLRHDLYDLGALRIDRIRTEDVEGARASHLEGHSPASVNLWLRILKLLCNWAVKRALIPKVPWKVSMLKLQKTPRKTLPTAKAADWLDRPSVQLGGRAPRELLASEAGARRVEELLAQIDDDDRLHSAPTRGRR